MAQPGQGRRTGFPAQGGMEISGWAWEAAQPLGFNFRLFGFTFTPERVNRVVGRSPTRFERMHEAGRLLP